jgi:hypothetical protein
MMEGRENWIRVTNHGDKFTGRFAGRDYVFAPNKPVDMPEEAANHIFDLDKEDKSRAILRLGWANTGAEFPTALERLAKLSFDDPPEMIEAPPAPRKRRFPRTGTAAPAVNASGTADGDDSSGGGDDDDDGSLSPPLIKSPPKGPRIGEVEAKAEADDKDF